MSGRNKRASAKSFTQLADLIGRTGIRLHPAGKPSAVVSGKATERVPAQAKTSLAPTDEELFRKAMKGVHRASWRHDPHPTSKSPAVIHGDADLEARRLMLLAVDGGFPVAIPDHPEYIEGWVGVAGKRFLPNLRNGIYSIQGQIDLHGYSRAEAETAVEDFIIRMSRLRSCCVKIIHGRGINSPTESATLKRSLQRLLVTRRMSRYVVAYASAPFRDGGVGAVYVLLTRALR